MAGILSTMVDDHPLTFRQLVERAATALVEGDRPLPMNEIARRCGISRAFLYKLFDGSKGAHPWTMHRIAEGLGVEKDEVERALAHTKDVQKTEEMTQ